MRNPLRKAILFATLLVLSVALVWFGTEQDTGPSVEWLSFVPMWIGFLVGSFALVFFILASLHVGGQAKLLAGVARLAEWRLTAAEWDRFRAFDKARALSNPDRLMNDLIVRKETHSQGVEVIVGQKSLMVDGSYHVLRPGGLPALRAIGWVDNSATPARPLDCLEFELAYPKGRFGGIRLMVLRIPIPPEAHDKARAVFHHFAPRLVLRPGMALRNPRRTYQVLAVLLVFSLAAVAGGWRAAEMNDETMLPSMFVVVGGGLAIFSVILGLCTLLLSSGKKS